ncbi:MAG: hypothetical protein Q7J98_13620 [Kiritimatiellia bacterium]|nr:hypothetical protein [Kiritimatiellia bacterium]
MIPHLARALDPSLDVVDPVPLDDKKRLRRECGQWAKALLDRGCARVLIIWDLLPDWGEYEGKGCRHDDKEQIAQSLRSAGLRPTDRRIRLVCIEKMLEAWIRADERALSAFLSTAAHPIGVKRYKDTESLSDPKSALIELFRKSGSPIRRYVDYKHAIKIVRLLPDLNRLRRSESFRRFKAKLTGE